MSTYHKLRAGVYYIGDPGYIFSNSWGDLLNKNGYFEDESLLYNINEHLCRIGPTIHGDGSYYNENEPSMEFGVDTGLLSIMPVELISLDNKVSIEDIKKSDYAHIVKFDKDFIAEIKNGVFTFGNIVIDTDPGWDDEEIMDLNSFDLGEEAVANVLQRIEEKVNYLYNICINGSAKDYREILDWLQMSPEDEAVFNLTMLGLDHGSDKTLLDHLGELHVKDKIKQALNAQNTDEKISINPTN